MVLFCINIVRLVRTCLLFHGLLGHKTFLLISHMVVGKLMQLVVYCVYILMAKWMLLLMLLLLMLLLLLLLLHLLMVELQKMAIMEGLLMLCHTGITIGVCWIHDIVD